MTPTINPISRQAELYAESYLGSVFYYCLKKTGNHNEAEELAADISLTVLDQLRKAPPPERFSPWLWTIARRRYARWVDARTRERERRVFDSREDDSDEIMPEPVSDESVEDGIIEAEQYALMRRELAFISKEHRELIVAHYFENIGISELSGRLGVPPGTVKTRLMRARKLIGEVMNMAREFGKRSYRPEDIRFCASGNQPDGLPWKAVERKIPQNILLEASGNPSTAEELSMELGIALPYMEDELGILERATLLERVGDKYVTSFYIVGRETQFEIWQTLRRDSKERAKLLDEAISDNYQGLLELVKPACSEEDFRWFLYVSLIDSILRFDRTVFSRPNGGNWGFVGYEQGAEIPENNFTNHNVYGTDTARLNQYAVFRFGFRVLEYCPALHSDRIALFGRLIKDGESVDALVGAELDMLEDLENSKLVRVEDGRLIPNIVVLLPGVWDEIQSRIFAHPSGQKLKAETKSLFDGIVKILAENSNEVLHRTLGYYANAFMYDIRAMLMADEVEAGILKVPEKPETSLAGTWLDIGK